MNKYVKDYANEKANEKLIEGFERILDTKDICDLLVFAIINYKNVKVVYLGGKKAGINIYSMNTKQKYPIKTYTIVIDDHEKDLIESYEDMSNREMRDMKEMLNMIDKYKEV